MHKLNNLQNTKTPLPVEEWKPCITNLKVDIYTSIRRRRLGIPTRHNHFTRSWLHGFLAQSVVQIEDEGYQQHIASNVYHHDTGTKQTIEKLLAGKDGNIWKQSLSNKFGRLAQRVGQNRNNNKYVQGTNAIFYPSFPCTNIC